jgi:transposase
MFGAGLELRHMSISERKVMPEPVRRIEVFTGAGRRRNWSDAEKASIVAESDREGETVSGVARRYGLTPQQLFTWRRLARHAPSAEEVAETPQPAAILLFVPGVVEPAEPKPSPPSCRARRRRKASEIELEIGGVEVRIGADADPRAIAVVIRALKASA